MRSILLMLLMGLGTITWAQNDEKYVDDLSNEFISKLAERGITDVVSSKRHCSGAIEMFQIDGKICTSKGSYYEIFLVWKDEDNSFIKKIDNCGLFLSVPLESDTIVSYMKQNISDIKTEEVKKYKLENAASEPTLRTSVQPCFRNIRTTHGETTVEIIYNLFDVSNDGSEENLNYGYNNALNVVILDNMISEAIQKNQNKFRRQK